MSGTRLVTGGSWSGSLQFALGREVKMGKGCFSNDRQLTQELLPEKPQQTQLPTQLFRDVKRWAGGEVAVPTSNAQAVTRQVWLS